MKIPRSYSANIGDISHSSPVLTALTPETDKLSFGELRSEKYLSEQVQSANLTMDDVTVTFQEIAAAIAYSGDQITNLSTDKSHNKTGSTTGDGKTDGASMSSGVNISINSEGYSREGRSQDHTSTDLTRTQTSTRETTSESDTSTSNGYTTPSTPELPEQISLPDSVEGKLASLLDRAQKNHTLTPDDIATITASLKMYMIGLEDFFNATSLYQSADSGLTEWMPYRMHFVATVDPGWLTQNGDFDAVLELEVGTPETVRIINAVPPQTAQAIDQFTSAYKKLSTSLRGSGSQARVAASAAMRRMKATARRLQGMRSNTTFSASFPAENKLRLRFHASMIPDSKTKTHLQPTSRIITATILIKKSDSPESTIADLMKALEASVTTNCEGVADDALNGALNGASEAISKARTAATGTPESAKEALKSAKEALKSAKEALKASKEEATGKVKPVTLYTTSRKKTETAKCRSLVESLKTTESNLTDAISVIDEMHDQKEDDERRASLRSTINNIANRSELSINDARNFNETGIIAENSIAKAEGKRMTPKVELKSRRWFETARNNRRRRPLADIYCLGSGPNHGETCSFVARSKIEAPLWHSVKSTLSTEVIDGEYWAYGPTGTTLEGALRLKLTTGSPIETYRVSILGPGVTFSETMSGSTTIRGGESLLGLTLDAQQVGDAKEVHALIRIEVIGNSLADHERSIVREVNITRRDATKPAKDDDKKDPTITIEGSNITLGTIPIKDIPTDLLKALIGDRITVSVIEAARETKATTQKKPKATTSKPK